VARRLEADCANAQRVQQEAHRDALADVTNTQAAPAEDASSGNDLAFIASAGKKFAVTMMIWLPAGKEDEIWATEEDEDFNPLDRFGEEGQPANKTQGALSDIYAVVPEEYRDAEDFNDWIPAVVRALSFRRPVGLTAPSFSVV
jgi:hypothetical protein